MTGLTEKIMIHFFPLLRPISLWGPVLTMREADKQGKHYETSWFHNFKANQKTQQKSSKIGTTRLISIDFPAPKMEPESAHVAPAVSVHWLQCGDCDAARPRQYTTPGQKFFLLTSCSNPLPLDSWQVSYESHGGSRISWFALKEFYFIPTWNTIRHAGHAKWG